MTNLDSAKGLLETIEVKTQAARLRAIMPDILRRLDEGVSHEQIVEALNRSDQFDLGLGTFRKYLYRYRKKLNGSDKSITRKKENFSSGTAQNFIPDSHDDEVKSQSERLDEVINARNRGTLGDDYINRSRPIFGNSRSKKI